MNENLELAHIKTFTRRAHTTDKILKFFFRSFFFSDRSMVIRKPGTDVIRTFSAFLESTVHAPAWPRADNPDPWP